MVDIKFEIHQSIDGSIVYLGRLKVLEGLHTNSNWFWSPVSKFFERDEILWKKDLEIILNTIFRIYPKNTTYYIDAESEIFWTPYLKKKNVFEYLLLKFKDKKLIIKDGNLYPTNSDIPFETQGECVFFGGSSSINNQFPILPRKFMRNFTCLQEVWKPSRYKIYSCLYDNNLLYKTFYTLSTQNKKSEYHYFEDDGTNFHMGNENTHEKINGKSILFYPNQWYRASFCNIVTESSFYSYEPTNTTPKKIFFTEKTEKCFTAGQPFILVGNKNGLKKLKEFGFKTFSTWWDESYDECDDDERMEKIENLIKNIGSWSLKKCEETYAEMMPVLKHNQELNNKLKKQPAPKRYVSIELSNDVISYRVDDEKEIVIS